MNAESIYGAVLAARGRYQEAEPLVVSSYEALRDDGERAPEQMDALERVIDLYEAWGKSDEAARYRALKD